MLSNWDVTFKVKQRSGKDMTSISAKTAGAAYLKGETQYFDRFGYKREDVEWFTVFPQGEQHG